MKKIKKFIMKCILRNIVLSYIEENKEANFNSILDVVLKQTQGNVPARIIQKT